MTTNEIAEMYTERVKELEVYANIARDSGLQLEAIKALNALLEDIRKIKGVAVQGQDSSVANLCLGCECAINCVVNEIAMWLKLKTDDPNAAWDHLITAQNSAAAAVRADPGFSRLRNRCNYLLAVEKIVFPPQVFTSAGLIVGGGTCTICRMEYGECCHIVGRPYMGEFCAVELHGPIEPDHVSIVDDPEDKCCRVTSFGVGSGHRDKMTWIVTPDSDGRDQSHTARMIMLRTV